MHIYIHLTSSIATRETLPFLNKSLIFGSTFIYISGVTISIHGSFVDEELAIISRMFTMLLLLPLRRTEMMPAFVNFRCWSSISAKSGDMTMANLRSFSWCRKRVNHGLPWTSCLVNYKCIITLHHILNSGDLPRVQCLYAKDFRCCLIQWFRCRIHHVFCHLLMMCI